ncbi:probable ATP-dependent RNA helicase ddx56 [Durio zibethinus]|uniref:Probable ATP-dependent RNA helicase ddx56 n=1 Tax=Durio zibethinus TaxID=66656 RepID=A0A6P5X7J5_DURZI|nr:probable ATP-dependent RNA helicase ddx56 [Durio zibethinus]
MLKQSASRNQRYKGFKVKHVLQICALLALCIWLLNQVRNPYDKGSGIFQKVTSEHEALKLGRKDLDLQGQGSSTDNKESGEIEAEEVEESKPEESEDDGNEIDRRDREKAEGEESEEVEDFIDEEDRENENQIENLSLLEEQAMNEGDENLQDPRELEHYKSDGASSAVMQSNLDSGIAAQIRRLRSVGEMVKKIKRRGKETVSSLNEAFSIRSSQKRLGGIPENTIEILLSSTRSEKVSVTEN